VPVVAVDVAAVVVESPLVAPVLEPLDAAVVLVPLDAAVVLVPLPAVDGGDSWKVPPYVPGVEPPMALVPP
jgi:hypothetical protein